MAGYIRLCDKDIDKHTDPVKRRKIAKAKLKEMVDGPITRYQKILLDTLVPLFLEIHEMSKRHGEDDFDMRTYLSLQNTLATMLSRFTGYPSRPRVDDKRKGKGSSKGDTSQKPQNGSNFDLGAIIGS